MDIVINLPRPKGTFSIRKWKNNEIVYDSGDFNNIVVDNFYAQWINELMSAQNNPASNTRGSDGMMNMCVVSNDSSEVGVDDVNISSIIGQKNRYTSVYPVLVTIEGVQYWKRTLRYLWNQGEFDGVTISKVGVINTLANQNTDPPYVANRLLAGQLIKDGLGNPVTITILSDEQLDITYTMYIPVMSDIIGATSGTMILNGIEYNYSTDIYLSRLFFAYYITAYNGWLFFRSLYPSSIAGGNTITVNSTVHDTATATRTTYPKRSEFNYTFFIPSGTQYSSITNIDFGKLIVRQGNNYNGATINVVQYSEMLVRYNFTDVVKPSKLTTDTLEGSIKITIKWGEDD